MLRPENALPRAVRLAIAAAVTPLAVATVGAQPADTTRISTDPLFGRRDLVVAFAFGLGTAISLPSDRFFAEKLQFKWAQENRFLSRTAAVFREVGHPGALIIGTTMYAVGRFGGNERLADLGLHGTEALIAGSLIGSTIKALAGRQRPYMNVEKPHSFRFLRGFEADDFRSFPSGHTVAGFAAAAAVTKETNRWWPELNWLIFPTMYGGAALIGISRMYNNKHWASDVMMGAAIGSFAGRKIVRYHHSHPDNKIDDWFLSGSISPNANGGYSLRWMILPR